MARIPRFLTDEQGSVAAYAAFFTLIALGSGALAIDVGRAAVLRAQLQNRADAGALAAAVQLDGRPGSRARAEAMARQATTQTSALTSGTSVLTVAQVNFFSAVDPAATAAVDDTDAKFVEVVMEPRRIDYVLAPILGIGPSGNTTAPVSSLMRANALATARPFICHAPPLMICDPAEVDASQDLSLPSAIGRQIALMPAPQCGAWSPGNFGLLALPDGSLGASDLETALASVVPEDCYSLDVTTAPGVKTNKIESGINARFDEDSPTPAPNVIAYPRDPEVQSLATGVLGSGNWNAEGYWTARHGGSLPADLAGASRYQVYLYELGLQFGRLGRQTAFPLAAPDLVPTGYTLVDPPAADIPTSATYPTDPWFDGHATNPPAPNGPARRLVEVAVLRCLADNVRGSHSYPTHGNYVEMFITEPVPDWPPGVIIGEIVRPLTPSNDPDFHANVTLVR